MENNKTLQIKEKSLKKGIITIILVLICILSTVVTTHAAVKNTWIKKSGKTYYYNNKGKKVTGLKKIKSNYYYFDKKGVLYKKGWKTVKGGKYYFAKTNGKAYKGNKTIGGKKYLFSTKCKLYGTGINAYGGKKYYTVNGMIQTGWKTVSGKTYYFNAKGVMQTGKWIDKVYYVNADGVMQKNCWIRLSDGNYYADASGKKVKSCWLTIGDYKYYFNTSGKNSHTVKIIPWEDETAGGDADEPDGNGSSNDVIENTLLNRSIYRTDIKNKIDQLNNKISNMLALNGIAEGYEQALAIINNAQAVVDSYNSYTATQLYHYYNELEAKINALTLKANQVLTYYPEQSKAIFDAINEYRRSLGIAELVWSDNLSKTARLECGYYCYLLSENTSGESDEDFLNHHVGGMNSCIKIGGKMTVDEIVYAWINSGSHRILLEYASATYGTIAYYTYNDSNGRTWSKSIFAIGVADAEGITNATPEYYDIILNCATSNRTFE